MISDRLPIAEVVWVDIATTGGWKADPSEATSMLVRSVGYLHTSKKYVRVTQSHSDTDDWADTTCIPRSVVKSVTIIARRHVARVRGWKRRK